MCMNLEDAYFYYKIRNCAIMRIKNNITGFLKLRDLLIF